jgi:NADPH-dependent glutamate synthase beta subunit-like oxidoreductase
MEKHDAVLIAAGAEHPRDPELPGMDLTGCHYAMPYLVQQNRRVNKEKTSPSRQSTPLANMWLSSGAATQRPTASAPRSARVACR